MSPRGKMIIQFICNNYYSKQTRALFEKCFEHKKKNFTKRIKLVLVWEIFFITYYFHKKILIDQTKSDTLIFWLLNIIAFL